MELITRWLKGNRNFIIGKSLYASFGKDEALKKLFNQGETPFSKAKLATALEAILNTQSSFQPHTSTDSFKAMPGSNDSVLQAIQNAWKEKYAKMNLLRHELDKYEKRNDWEAVAKCKTMVKEILELEQEVNQLWDKRDEYLENGKLPGVKENEFVIPEDPVKLGKLIESLKKNIRRNKLKAKENPNRAEYAALVKDYESRLQEILNKK